MPEVPYPYEVNGKLVTENGSLIPICSLPSLTVINVIVEKISKQEKTMVKRPEGKQMQINMGC